VISARKIKKGSSLATNLLTWRWDVPLASPVEYADIPLSGVTVGSVVSTGFLTRSAQSLVLTSVYSLAATFRLTGRDSFNNQQIEDVVLAGGSSLQTNNCWTRIDQILLLAHVGSFAASDSVTVGIGNYDVRLPAYEQGVTQDAIQAITCADTPGAPNKLFLVEPGRSNVLIYGYVSGKVIAHMRPQYVLGL
jgi:hypothetical protein